MIAGSNQRISKRLNRTRTARYTDETAQSLRDAMGPGYAAGVTEQVIQQATRR